MWNAYDQLRRGRHIVRVLTGRDLYAPIQIRRNKTLLGKNEADWCICPDGLGEQSVVYSFGAGTDISFDLELIGRFGVRVHVFDPTPRSLAWIRSQRTPEEFRFHDYGLNDHDGTALFHPPDNEGFVSYRIFSRDSALAEGVEAPVYRLTTIMKKLSHDRVDLLKMDIEGAEYGVIRDLLNANVPVGQLLVEFHHRWKDVGIERTREAIRSLNRAGFKIFHVSPGGADYSFLRG
jgi:FkbM family methyltransferase